MKAIIVLADTPEHTKRERLENWVVPRWLKVLNIKPWFNTQGIKFLLRLF
jgi:hypothetical protein